MWPRFQQGFTVMRRIEDRLQAHPARIDAEVPAEVGEDRLDQDGGIDPAAGRTWSMRGFP